MTTEADKKVAADGEEEELELQPFKFYLMPANTYVIIEKKWGVFTSLTGVSYLFHLVWMCYGVDVYSSYERHSTCTDAGTFKEASSVYDGYILVCIIFHMIEWIRQTVFATSALVGVNLVGVYYALFLAVPPGIIAMLTGAFHAVTLGGDCGDAQPNRSLFLKLQFVAAFLTIITCCLHVIVFKMKGVEWCHEIFIMEEEEDDD